MLRRCRRRQKALEWRTEDSDTPWRGVNAVTQRDCPWPNKTDITLEDWPRSRQFDRSSQWLSCGIMNVLHTAMCTKVEEALKKIYNLLDFFGLNLIAHQISSKIYGAIHLTETIFLQPKPICTKSWDKGFFLSLYQTISALLMIWHSSS